MRLHVYFLVFRFFFNLILLCGYYNILLKNHIFLAHEKLKKPPSILSLSFSTHVLAFLSFIFPPPLMLVEGQSERCDVMISLLSILCALEANTYHTKLVYYNPLRQIPKGTFAVNRAHTYLGVLVYMWVSRL